MKKTISPPSFAASSGKEEINWFGFLNKSMEDVTKEELDKMTSLSKDWVTCAVGNQCSIIPRHPGWGRPFDITLCDLGASFHLSVYNMSHWAKCGHLSAYEYRRAEAISILEKIEERSFILISEIISEQKPKRSVARKAK